MKRRRYDDQITFPVELPIGVALRNISQSRGVSLATLVRDLVIEGIRHDPELLELVGKLSEMTPVQLIAEREETLSSPTWLSSTSKLLEEKAKSG